MTAFDFSFLKRMRWNRDVLFFSLNAAGWISWGLAQYVGFMLSHERDYPFLSLAIVAVSTGFLLTTGLRYLCRVLWQRPPAVLLAGGIVSAYASALLMRIVINLTDKELSHAEIALTHWYDIFSGVLWSSYLIIGWMGLYFGIHYYEAHQRERERALRAAALAQAAQLKMLRYQLNPHFLFNTLNAISTLVLEQRSAVANTVITKLAEFLRYTLEQDPMKTVTLTQELAAINLYLEIEKLRFGDRLRLQFEIDPAVTHATVPSLLLQPFIENSIKYAVAPSERGGTLTIRATRRNSQMVLMLSDDGPGMREECRSDSGLGVGLRNTKERLAAMYGDAAMLEFANTSPGLSITLRLPLQTSTH